MAFEYAVVLTGSIATGKSTVANCFTEFGFIVVDADKIAHQILDEQSLNIAEMFGSELVQDAKVDRKALGRIVFTDTTKRELLEDLLHPLIYNEIEKRSKELDREQRPYLIDIPLFFESERYPIAKSIVVYTPKVLQVKRLMLRDGYNEEEALKRIALQMDIEVKREKATYVIDNSGDRKQLGNRCKAIREEILGDFL